MKYIQREDGDTIEIEAKNPTHRIACCDCGLVHELRFWWDKKTLYMEPYRNNRATGQRRRWMKKRKLVIDYERFN